MISDASVVAHKEAFLARLRQDPVLAESIFEGVVQNRPNRYATVYADTGRRAPERLSGRQSEATFRYVVHSIGTTPDQAHRVADHVIGQLLDFTLTVPGRVCRRIQHTPEQPVELDPDSKFWFVVDAFWFISSPDHSTP